MENNITDNKNKSGGPKTPEGKAVSKYNAVRHGILVKVLSGQEVAEANVIQNGLMSELKPKSLLEELLIETMAITYIRRQRIYQQEQILVLDASDDILGNSLNRYLTTSERQFYRALHELQRIQAIRDGARLTSTAVDITGNEID